MILWACRRANLRPMAVIAWHPAPSVPSKFLGGKVERESVGKKDRGTYAMDVFVAASACFLSLSFSQEVFAFNAQSAIVIGTQSSEWG